MTYHILDTDHLSILQRRTEPAFGKLSLRLTAVSPDLIFVTIISFQEQFQGWMAFINKAKSDPIITAYLKLESLIFLLSVFQIFSFDSKASEIAEKLRSQPIRLGTMDLRISSMTQSVLLLTINLTHFRTVNVLQTEAWTI